MARLAARIALVAAALTLPAPLAAQSLERYDYRDLRFRAIGPEMGWVVPTEVEPAASYGIRADMGYVGPSVRVVPSMRYWSSRLSQVELDRLAEQIVSICERQGNTDCPVLDLGEVERSDLELSADAHAVVEAARALSVYAGAGLSLHLFNGRGELIDDTFVEDLLDTAAPGLNLIVGASAPLGRLSLFTEGRLIVTSDIQYANLLVGTSWTLPSGPPGGVEPAASRGPLLAPPASAPSPPIQRQRGSPWQTKSRL